MCRWLAYSGEPLRPATVILDTEHSLVKQSLSSPLGAESVNGDGFGFAWYARDAAAGSRPALFRSIEPAWHDQNLREITQAVESPLFFSHVRAATGPPIQQSNCHPFRFDHWLFMHNGLLADFAKVKRDLAFAVDPALYPHIQGTTDSELIFHLALTLGVRDEPIAGMARTVRLIEAVGRRHGIRFPVQGTMALCDGATIWAFRYSTQGRSRTLFHSVDIDTLRQMYPDAQALKFFGRRAHVVVSEPLNDLPGAFLEVPEATVAILDANGYHHEPFLGEGS